MAIDLREINERSDRMRLLTAALVEQQRRRDLLAGITAAERAFLDAERDQALPALVAQMRAENDQLEAELVRREELRLLG